MNRIIKEKGIGAIMENIDSFTFTKDEGKRVVLQWDTKQGKEKLGLFEVTIWNNKITDIRMCRYGSQISGSALTASDGSELFLREVHRCLGELLAYLDENK